MVGKVGKNHNRDINDTTHNDSGVADDGVHKHFVATGICPFVLCVCVCVCLLICILMITSFPFLLWHFLISTQAVLYGCCQRRSCLQGSVVNLLNFDLLDDCDHDEFVT